jgi:phosphohistidine phosphatase
MTVSNIPGHARMKVFLLRHTEAAYGGPDPDRQLTPKGHRVAEELARHIRGNPFFKFSEVWVSPYTRAQQTANPILKHADPNLKVVTVDQLVPHGESRLLLDRLNRTENSVLLVGHNPLLSSLGKRMLGVRGECHFPFKKGGLLVFKRDSEQSSDYTLSALLTPASLGIKA